MATLDKTRLAGANQKKVRSVSAVKLKSTDFNSTDTLRVINLPADCLITAAYAVVKTVANAGSTLDIGTTATGNELADNLALTTAGAVGAVITSEVDTGTGKSIFVTPNQALTAGEFHVIVEYIEYTRNNGELTNYAA